MSEVDAGIAKSIEGDVEVVRAEAKPVETCVLEDDMNVCIG